jgi:D-alanine-D-alanine ligase
MTHAHLRIAVLHGGPSSEHDISVWSSRGVLQTLRDAGHETLAVFVDRQGRWHLTAMGDAGVLVGNGVDFLDAIALLRGNVDLCFLGFHGNFGEDGKVQAVLELAGLRYTGSGVMASALAIDKTVTRRVYAGVGLPVAGAIELGTAGLEAPGAVEVAAHKLIAELGLPVVVKVPTGGSSVGVEIPRDEASLVASLRRLSPDAPTLLCEQFVSGVELTAAVLEREDGSLESLPIVEIVPKSAFFDYEAKYQTGGSEEIVPARITAEATAQAQRNGALAHRALGCAGYSRTDQILRPDGSLVLLETNTLPGLTPASLLPKAAGAVGLSYAALLDRVIAAALRSDR